MSFGKCHHGFEATSCGLCQQERTIENMRIQQENEHRHREAMRIQEKQYELAKERENRERYESEQRRRQSNPISIPNNNNYHAKSNAIDIESIDVFVRLNNNLEFIEITGANLNNNTVEINDEVYGLVRSYASKYKKEIQNLFIKEAYKFGATCQLYRKVFGGVLQVNLSSPPDIEIKFKFYFSLLTFKNYFVVDPDKLGGTIFYNNNLIDEAFREGIKNQISNPEYGTPVEKYIPEWFENLFDRHPFITLIILISLLLWVFNKIKSLFG